MDYRPNIPWHNLWKVVRDCSEKAKKHKWVSYQCQIKLITTGGWAWNLEWFKLWRGIPRWNLIVRWSRQLRTIVTGEWHFDKLTEKSSSESSPGSLPCSRTFPLSSWLMHTKKSFPTSVCIRAAPPWLVWTSLHWQDQKGRNDCLPPFVNSSFFVLFNYLVITTLRFKITEDAGPVLPMRRMINMVLLEFVYQNQVWEKSGPTLSTSLQKFKGVKRPIMHKKLIILPLLCIRLCS